MAMSWMVHEFEWISPSQSEHTLLHLVNTWEDQISQHAAVVIDLVMVAVVVAVIVVVVDTVVVGTVVVGTEEVGMATDDQDRGPVKDLLTTEIDIEVYALTGISIDPT